MNLVELRQNLKNYHAHLEEFYLAKNLGQNPSVSLAEIEENASDLFSVSTIESLKKLIEESADATEIERKARQNLLNISRLEFLKNKTKEISEELENCQNAVSINFQNETLNTSEVLRKIESLPKAKERREVFIRLLDAKNSCADLQIEKISQLEEKTKTLGCSNLQKLFEEITELNFYNFAQKAQDFLEKTENFYFQSLAETAQKAGLEKHSLHTADFFYLRKLFERKEIFDGENLPRFYSKILENFNFSEYKIPNIKLKEVTGRLQTKVFRTNLPEDIYFCISKRNGVPNYIEFLRSFGKANFAAWISKELLNRFPEFVFSPDDILSKAYGFLFQTLLTEEAFLRKNLGIWDEKLSGKIKQENEFWLLFKTRREILRFWLENRIFSASENLAEVCEQTAKIFTDNLNFGYEKHQMLWEISEKFSSLKNIRALLFAFGLREYFRERYGFDWWQKRKAFEELIDFWNAAERYKAEEMARMIGFEMSFDLLAENFKTKKN
ncbi:MAG: hypothetical protein LC768_14365 [Acidobacteria bacterium]|nr:hypothetical protein [Acidobacteriota bacterium]MCA1639494.1 hypothetical protein [Acidobacteriota bacterium]